MHTLNPDIAARIEAALGADSGLPPLHTIAVFGSHARGEARPDSDLDLAVQGERPLQPAQHARFVEALALAFGCPIDLVDLSQAGQPLLSQIIASAVRIRGSDAAWGRLIFRNIMDQEDFVPLQQRILAARRRAWLQQ